MMIERRKLLPEWDWGIEVKGVENADLARTLSRDTTEMLHLLAGAGFDLRTLDGVTIALDYARAIAEIDRGSQCRSVARATVESGVEGVAMAIGVMREGRQRTHLVLTAWIPALLRSQSEEKRRQAFGAIAHEAAHIHFAATLESRIPNAYGDAFALRRYPPTFQNAALHVWDEYAATRMSGSIDPNALEGYCENIRTLVASSETFRSGPMMAYRKHGDFKRLFVELSGFIERLLCSFAYLLGHLDSLDQPLESTSMVEAWSGLAGTREGLSTMQDCLRGLWNTQESWKSLEVFAPICALMHELLRGCGVGVVRSEDGWRMSILDVYEGRERDGSDVVWDGARRLAS